MTLLDRYLVKKFLFVLFFACIAFSVVFIIVDLIEHLDRFLDSKAPVSRTVVYYLYYVPYILTLTLPVNLLLSCLFSLGSMTKYNELVAAMSSGISLFRIVLPILILSFFISVTSGLATETVLPEMNKNRLDIYEHEIRNLPRDKYGMQSKLSLQDSGGRQVSIEQYNSRQQKATTVNIIWRKENRITERWDAKTMQWDSTRQTWIMQDIVQRKFDPDREEVARLDTLRYRTRILPTDLVELDKKPEEMSYVELRDFVEQLHSLGANPRKWRVELNMKLAYPLTGFIIVLFGAPFASHKRRSGTTIGFAFALLISFVFFGVIQSGKALGYSGALQPWLAAWIANIIFFTGGLVMMVTAKR